MALRAAPKRPTSPRPGHCGGRRRSWVVPSPWPRLRDNGRHQSKVKLLQTTSSKKCIALAFGIVLAFVRLGAQSVNPLSDELRQIYTIVRNNLIKMSERMPEANYNFKPTPEIQTFLQRVAHIADANMRTCSALEGEQKSVAAAFKTTKAEVIAALKESFETCDAVFNALTDASAIQMVRGEIGSPPTPPGQTRTRLSQLWNVVRHSNELYGYMSVYLRLKGIVPPSTAPLE